MRFLSRICDWLFPCFLCLGFFHSNWNLSHKTAIPNHRTIGEEMYDLLSSYAHLMDIAYCISPITRIEPPFQCENHCSDFPNLTLLDQWSTNDIDIIPTSFETSGYIAINETAKDIFIVLRGTRSFKDSLVDVSADMVDYEEEYISDKNNYHSELERRKCKVHHGFYQSYGLTWARIKPTLMEYQELLTTKKYKVTVLGHSLGGAISVLLSLKIMTLYGDHVLKRCVTMGQPRIGNKDFNEYVEQSFNRTDVIRYPQTFENSKILRVTRLADPIVKLPIDGHFFIGHEDYAHINSEIFINELGPQKPSIRNIYYCHGRKDTACSFGMRYPRTSYEHLNYFRRMGRCGFGNLPNQIS